MTNTLTGLLVGMHFHPPAKLVLECLPSGTPLTLRHEPDNPYDEDAVAVEVDLKHLAPSQRSRLEEELPRMGWTIEQVDEYVATGQLLQLGYIGAAKNKEVKALESEGITHNRVFVDANREVISWAQCTITLGFSAGGKPLVVLRAPERAIPASHDKQDPAEANWGDS